jgi:predicted amidophosphoribosyltransferase
LSVEYLVFRPSDARENVHSRRVELRAFEQQLTRSQPACPICSSAIEPDYIVCPVCTTMLRDQCAKCHAPLEQRGSYARTARRRSSRRRGISTRP